MVTPNALVVLRSLDQGVEPDAAIPELAKAGEYFNIPQLEVYADPIYNDLKRPTRLLRQAIEEDKPWLVDYIHKNYGVPVTEMNLEYAVTSNARNVVRMLLTWPNFNWSPNLFTHLLQRTTDKQMQDILLAAARDFNGRVD